MQVARAGWLIVTSVPLVAGVLLLGWRSRPTASMDDPPYMRLAGLESQWRNLLGG